MILGIASFMIFILNIFTADFTSGYFNPFFISIIAIVLPALTIIISIANIIKKKSYSKLGLIFSILTIVIFLLILLLVYLYVK